MKTIVKPNNYCLDNVCGIRTFCADIHVHGADDLTRAITHTLSAVCLDDGGDSCQAEGGMEEGNK